MIFVKLKFTNSENGLGDSPSIFQDSSLSSL